MEALNRLKAEANRSVVEGNRLFPDDASLPYFKKACAKYQEVISAMIAFECNGIEKSGIDGFLSDAKERDEYTYYKASIFSNYAMANLKLNNHEGCKRLSNVCIFLCINHSVLVRDIDMVSLVDLDITSLISASTTKPETSSVDTNDAAPQSPPTPPESDPNSLQDKLRKLGAKATFRRGQVSLARYDYLNAVKDFKTALTIYPNDSEIQQCLAEAESLLEKHGNLASTNAGDVEDGDGTDGVVKFRNVDQHLFVREFSKLDQFVSKGGVCLNGIAVWTQTKDLTKVYIPIDLLVGADPGDIQQSKLKVIFKKMNVEIIHDTTVIFEAKLEYFIEKTKCKWSYKLAGKLLEKKGIAASSTSTGEDSAKSSSTSINDVAVVTLQLCKTPSLEQFPGCEWWDRVFPSDTPVLVPLEDPAQKGSADLITGISSSLL